MMHTLRNRKAGWKRAQRRFTGAPRTSQTAVSPHLAGAIQDSIAKFPGVVGSKPECDTHTCLNLGFTAQNSQLTQVSRHVCYFWSSPF